MIAHIAGCDATGKSTLVSHLAKRLNYPTKHFDKPKDMLDGKQQYFNFIQANRKNWICDRLHDGEWIYAPLYRGYVADYLHEFERELIKNNNYVFIYVKAELETIIERARKRGEDFVKEEHFQTVLDYYSNYLSKQKMPFIEVDTTNASVGDGVKKARKAAEKVDKIWNMIRTFKTDVPKIVESKKVFPRGNVDAKYMFVQATPGVMEDNHYTILSEENGSSGIIEELKEKGFEKNTWFTSLVSCPTFDGRAHERQVEATKEIIQFQYNTIKPETIIVLDKRTEIQVKELFPDADVVILKNINKE